MKPASLFVAVGLAVVACAGIVIGLWLDRGTPARLTEHSAGAQHTVDWFVAHPEEWKSTLRACRNDQSLQLTADCLNANHAAHVEAERYFSDKSP